MKAGIRFLDIHLQSLEKYHEFDFYYVLGIIKNHEDHSSTTMRDYRRRS